jgi:hypothetical protein
VQSGIFGGTVPGLRFAPSGLRDYGATGLRDYGTKGYGMKGVSRCALLLGSWSQLRICVKVSGGISVPDNKVKSTQKQSIAYASTNSIAQNE